MRDSVSQEEKKHKSPAGGTLTGDDLVNDTKLMTILKSTPFFYDLTIEEFADIARETNIHRTDGETIIIREGERGDSLFLVVNGMLRVTTRIPGSNKNFLLGKLQAGDFFGEYSLLTGRLRSATVVTITPSELLEIPRKIYEKIVLRYKSICRFLVDLIIQHEKSTAETLKSLKIERRRHTRFKQRGMVKFQEYDNGGEDNVIKIGTGTIENISEGGVSFYVHDHSRGENFSDMFHKKYKARLNIDGVSSPIKLLGKIVSFERGISRRTLANYHIVRLKLIGIDKNDKPILRELIKNSTEIA